MISQSFPKISKAILVLGEPGGLLSKELLYTAITRQKEKLVILYNDAAYRLRDYSSVSCSEVARRFTCLFEAPSIVEYKKKYYEQSLIHRTLKGDLVRSKSEVIIRIFLFCPLMGLCTLSSMTEMSFLSLLS